MTQILVDGTIAPWLWNGNSYYQGQLIDPGIFGPAGMLLTGDAIHITWNSDPSITANITINDVTVTLGPATGFYAPYSTVSPTYQNITVTVGISVDSFDPVHAASYNPNGLGGALHLTGLDGYFYVTSMVDPSLVAVPGPIAGTGLSGLFVLVWLVMRFYSRVAREYRAQRASREHREYRSV